MLRLARGVIAPLRNDSETPFQLVNRIRQSATPDQIQVNGFGFLAVDVRDAQLRLTADPPYASKLDSGPSRSSRAIDERRRSHSTRTGSSSSHRRSHPLETSSLAQASKPSRGSTRHSAAGRRHRADQPSAASRA